MTKKGTHYQLIHYNTSPISKANGTLKKRDQKYWIKPRIKRDATRESLLNKKRKKENNKTNK